MQIVVKVEYKGPIVSRYCGPGKIKVALGVPPEHHTLLLMSL